jgi:hypothetical protein
MTEIEEKSLLMAQRFIQLGLSNLDVFELSDLLIKLEQDKEDRNSFTDSYIDFNDEIASIENVGLKETIDISVSGDNLFYCNDILTKNSFGVVACVDTMVALIKTDELEQLDQVMFKQIRNRDNDVSMYKRFVVGVDKSKMRLYDVEQNAQVDALDVALNESYNDEDEKKQKIKDKFGGFKF